MKEFLLNCVGLGLRDKANSLQMGPGPAGAMPCVGVFLSDLCPYSHEFRRKPRKTPNG